MTAPLPRLAVLVSGSGTNLQAIVDARARGELAGDVAVAISNRPGVKALDRARAAGVEALVLDHKAFADRTSFDAALDRELRARGIDLVVLAGFMRLLGAPFVQAWSGRLVNLHPSLLPAFPGAHAIRDALEAKVAKTGITIHFVDAGTDTGPIIVQAALDVRDDDTEASLASRIHALEHRLYPRVVDLMCRGLVRLENGAVVKPPELA